LRSLTKSNLWVYLVLAAILFGGLFGEPEDSSAPKDPPTPTSTPTNSTSASPTPAPTPSPSAAPSRALKALGKLEIKGRAPKTGYSREQFSDGWATSRGCDTRNRILQRDLLSYTLRSGSSCIVETGVLQDPFTGTAISFERGVVKSQEVQIDHVVALSDAWQKGAQQLTTYQRFLFYNDPLNLLAVAGWANAQKGDSDAASWLPPNRGFRCEYVARQISVKLKYQLWVTQAEADAMAGILEQCPRQRLPSG
jgi:hypothetical protein